MRITITVHPPEPNQNQLPGSSPLPADVCEHIKRLKDENSSVRSLAAMALKEIGDPQAVEPLCVMLRDEDNSVRAAAAEALVQIGEPSVLPLCAALTDPISYVRAWASRALKEIGDPRAVEPLCVMLMDKDSGLHVSAAIALGEIGDARAVEALYVALCNDEDPAVRHSVTRALAQIGEGSVLLLCAALQDKNWSVRIAAANALQYIGDIRAVEPLCSVLKDKVVYVSYSASIALGCIGDTTTLPLRLLSSPILTLEQRLKALEALTDAKVYSAGKVVHYKIGNLQTFCENLCQQVDKEESVRRGAAEVLAELRNRADAKILLRATTRNEPQERAELLRGVSGPSNMTASGELLRPSDNSGRTPSEKPGILSRFFKRK
jgi:HEAT repeat protein